MESLRNDFVLFESFDKSLQILHKASKYVPEKLKNEKLGLALLRLINMKI